MASTVFSPGTVIASSWLNDVNAVTYGQAGNAKLYGAKGDGVTDDYLALQTAITSNARVYIPKGTYLISQSLQLRTDSEIYGEAQKSVFIQGAPGINIFVFPYVSTDTRIENLYFQGAGCTAMVVAATAGPFATYLPRARIRFCHFSFDLTTGINAALINSTIEYCSFGYTGPNNGNGTWQAMQAIRSEVTFATNYVNINSVRHCIFKAGGNTDALAAVYLNAGELFHFVHCDFEFGGKVLFASNLSGLKFEGCWFENNTSSTAIIGLATNQGATFDHCWISYTATGSFLTWASGWLTNKLSFTNCEIGLGANSTLFTDSTTANTFGPTDGRFFWRNNVVNGGSALQRHLTTSECGGRNTPKGWATFNTATPGTLLAASDPQMSLGYNSVGDVTLNFPYPIGATTNSISVQTSGTALFVTGFASGVQAVRVQSFSKTSPATPTDGVVHVTVYGV